MVAHGGAPCVGELSADPKASLEALEQPPSPPPRLRLLLCFCVALRRPPLRRRRSMRSLAAQEGSPGAKGGPHPAQPGKMVLPKARPEMKARRGCRNITEEVHFLVAAAHFINTSTRDPLPKRKGKESSYDAPWQQFYLL